MRQPIVLLSGPIASGKSTLAKNLTIDYRFQVVRSTDLLSARLAVPSETDRKSLQAAGDALDEQTEGGWLCEELLEHLRENAIKGGVVVDAVRNQPQLDALRRHFGSALTHVHLTAPVYLLRERYEQRAESRVSDTGTSYEEARDNLTETQVERLRSTADIVIDTERSTDRDVLVRAAAHMRIDQPNATALVDVIVGGQFGSEGKGQIAHYIANEYDLLIRVGGPNAGHKVFEEPHPYTHHHLPSGTRRSKAHLLIGPGAVIRESDLLLEAEECGVGPDRLSIDPNAMVISDDDIAVEHDLVKRIGSTGQGVGAASARRITERSIGTVTAGKIAALRGYIRPSLEVLTEAFRNSQRICLEGTQGTGLSLYHGDYPYVTSRDTTVAGCLAEAGISPRRVRNILMVCRTYPIRVSNPADGTSGQLKQELRLHDIAHRSGLRLKELQETERTSTTNRRRRIGEFDWELLRRSATLNQPTDIALTFVDYLSETNRKAIRFEQLTHGTVHFIQEIERVSGARVSLISTGFNPRSIIDRRNW